MSKMPIRRPAAAVRFRPEIEAAAANGVAREDMVLHLTASDASRLKRDPAVPVEDLSFAGGMMRFLGVRVEAGGVADSELKLP